MVSRYPPVKASVSRIFVMGDDLSERSMKEAWVKESSQVPA